MRMNQFRNMLLPERRKRNLRRFFWDLWDDHNAEIYWTAWGVVALFLLYGLWVCAR